MISPAVHTVDVEWPIPHDNTARANLRLEIWNDTDRIALINQTRHLHASDASVAHFLLATDTLPSGQYLSVFFREHAKVVKSFRRSKPR